MIPEDSDDLLDSEEETQEFAAVMFPFLVLGFKKGKKLVKDDAGKIADDVLRKLKKKAALDAAEIVGTTKEGLQKVIDQAIEDGASVRKLSKEIAAYFNTTTGYRTLRVARTELTSAINDGTLEALVEEGNEEKEWSTVIDGNERESHARANGQVVGIHEMFELDGGSCMAPGDSSLPPEESMNCRCVVVSPRSSRAARHNHGEKFLRAHGALERRYVIELRKQFARQKATALSSLPA